MRAATFIVFAFVAIVLETSVRRMFEFESLGNVSPSFVACLVVFISLFASRRAALWGVWTLGLLVDLTSGFVQTGLNELVYVPGPYALGYPFAALLVLQIRPMVFRRRLITIAVFTAMAIIAASLVAIAFYVLRNFYPEADAVRYPIEDGAMRELGRRLGVAVYSALLALPLGWLLRGTIPLWGFTGMQSRTGDRR